LVELLNEKGEVINPEYKKYYVSSQDEFTKIGSQDNDPIDFGDECQTSGFLRFSLVNENETQPAYFDDFEITHKANPQKLTVSSWAEYYAFGKVAKASCPANGAYRYGYQGEFAEKDGETEWNSFELRQYDSEIGRFTTTDPMGEFWSSYVGMGNDPVNLTDPTGGETDPPTGSKALIDNSPNKAFDAICASIKANVSAKLSYAWETTRTWNASDIAGFANFVFDYWASLPSTRPVEDDANYSTLSEGPKNNFFQCSQLVVHLAMGYARKEGLELILTNDAGVTRSSSNTKLDIFSRHAYGISPTALIKNGVSVAKIKIKGKEIGTKPSSGNFYVSSSGGHATIISMISNDNVAIAEAQGTRFGKSYTFSRAYSTIHKRTPKFYSNNQLYILHHLAPFYGK
jgi:RHS repeat-associated protein